MKLQTALLLALTLALPGTAAAQQRICSLALSDFSTDLDAIEATLEAADFKESGILVEIFDREWECLSTVIPVAELVRYAYLKAYLAFHSQDAMGSISYTRLADYVAPEAPWPAWVPAEHPIRSQLEWEDPTEVRTVEQKFVNHPKKGGVFMNGLFLETPSAPVDVPVFVQVFDKSGDKQRGFWQRGAEFPPELLDDGPTETDPPRWFEPPALAPTGPVAAEPASDPPAPRPTASKRKRRMAWTFGLGGGAAALYGGAWGLRAAYDNNPTDGLYTTTNTTAIASAVVATVAVGTLVSALLAPGKNARPKTALRDQDREWAAHIDVFQRRADGGL